MLAIASLVSQLCHHVYLLVSQHFSSMFLAVQFSSMFLSADTKPFQVASVDLSHCFNIALFIPVASRLFISTSSSTDGFILSRSPSVCQSVTSFSSSISLIRSSWF